MKAFMTFITNYYWIFLIISAVLIISVVGIKAEDKKNGISSAGSKTNKQPAPDSNNKK